MAKRNEPFDPAKYKPLPKDAFAETPSKIKEEGSGAEGKTYELSFFTAARILGLDYKRVTNSEMWDFRPVGPGWERLITSVDINLKVAASENLFNASGLAKLFPWSELGWRKGERGRNLFGAMSNQQFSSEMSKAGFPRGLKNIDNPEYDPDTASKTKEPKKILDLSQPIVEEDFSEKKIAIQESRAKKLLKKMRISEVAFLSPIDKRDVKRLNDLVKKIEILEKNEELNAAEIDEKRLELDGMMRAERFILTKFPKDFDVELLFKDRSNVNAFENRVTHLEIRVGGTLVAKTEAEHRGTILVRVRRRRLGYKNSEKKIIAAKTRSQLWKADRKQNIVVSKFSYESFGANTPEHIYFNALQKFISLFRKFEVKPLSKASMENEYARVKLPNVKLEGSFWNKAKVLPATKQNKACLIVRDTPYLFEIPNVMKSLRSGRMKFRRQLHAVYREINDEMRDYGVGSAGIPVLVVNPIRNSSFNAVKAATKEKDEGDSYKLLLKELNRAKYNFVDVPQDYKVVLFNQMGEDLSATMSQIVLIRPMTTDRMKVAYILIKSKKGLFALGAVNQKGDYTFISIPEGTKATHKSFLRLAKKASRLKTKKISEEFPGGCSYEDILLETSYGYVVVDPCPLVLNRDHLEEARDVIRRLF